ncbi:MAG: hypothetical protein CR981_02745 [Proteobacteria bacterium]|nr:MAG: hypothetical protein CR981_02745 [Pseudomonadota bacterium]
MAGLKQKRLQEAFEEHSIEGMEVLQGTSSLAAHAIIYITLLILLTALVWSFLTKSDVIITAKGRLVESTEAKKIYSPVAGELIEIFVSEGVPVSKGDLIARIKSTQAVQIASTLTQAKLNLDNAALQKHNFPQEKLLMERELESIKRQIKLLEIDYNREKSDGLKKLSDSQKRQLKMTRLQLSEKRQAQAQATDIYKKYKRLHESPGGGGISKQQLVQKKNELDMAESAIKQLVSQIEDLELNFAAQNIANSQKIEKLHMDILRTRLQYDQKKSQLENAEKQLELKYLGAQDAYEAALRVHLEDLDENNFLIIRAPVSGEISTVSYKQPGEKVSPSRPIAYISRKDADKVLSVAIPDKDRGLLQVGQRVKIKFHAFPYQRFGFLSGKLQYLSNKALSNQAGNSLYRGTVRLDKDHFLINSKKVPIRFGMNADAEIIVQRRRLIDFIIDPLRKRSTT